jgi:hypothetical protein
MGAKGLLDSCGLGGKDTPAPQAAEFFSSEATAREAVRFMWEGDWKGWGSDG